MKKSLLLIILSQLLISVHLLAKELDLSPAKWIWYPSERTLQNTFILFRKEIILDEIPATATGWIAADSRYQLFINGQRVQWGPAPFDPRWQEADPVDIRKYLKPGKNVIACQVLFYGTGDGTSPLGIPGFIMKLELGKTELVTDNSWKSFLARCWNPGQYKRWYLRALQENFDARLYPAGWNDTDFRENNEWIAAAELDGSAHKASASDGLSNYQLDISGNTESQLRERSIPLMRENLVEINKLTESFWINWKIPAENYFDMNVPETYSAEPMSPQPDFTDKSLVIQPNGSKAAVLTFEFKEQSVGWPHFTIDAPEGTVVELLVHEAHKPGDAVLINSHFNSWSRFICREGKNTFSPFDYESLRWLQLHIRNFSRPVKVSNVGMLRRQFDYTVSPQITISDKVIQKVMDASVNTLYNSAQDIIVDGMARERQQYSGDGSHQLYPVYQAFGETKLPGRFVTTFSQGMTTDGWFLDSWPAYDRLARLETRELGWSYWGPLLDHGIGFIMDTYNYYLYSGDTVPVKEAYPRLLKFYRYLKTATDASDGLLRVENTGVPGVWIDHIAFKKQKHKQLAFNLYASAILGNYLYSLCNLFGDKAIASEVKQFSDDIHNNCIKKFWSADLNVFIDNKPWMEEENEIRYSDRALATALLFHMCPGGDERKSLDILRSFPPELGISYPCNAVWRYWALAENSELETLMYDLRNQWGKMPSVWENNTLQEDWNSTHDSSSQWSHCAVAPIVLLYQGLAGAKPLKPGGTTYRIWPRPCDLELLKLDIQTTNGAIGFRTEGLKGNRVFTMQVPKGVDVELWLDSREKCSLPLIAREKTGISRYNVKGGSELKLKLRYM